jgi:uncharacterized cupin superfamily protein
MAKIDVSKLPMVEGSRYPAPFDEPCKRRSSRRLGEAAGLTQFGVNIVRVPPGSWSSQRHWHSHEDEFVYVLEGEATLVTDAGPETLRAGDCAGFKGGVRDGHHIRNESKSDFVFLVVGTRIDEDHGEYPDIDMVFTAQRYAGPQVGALFKRKDGTPY